MHTRIEIACRRRGAETVVDRLASCGLLRARLLPPRGGLARVALVQTAASLLSGDVVRIDVVAGPGTALEIVEVAGLVAHDVRGGAPADLVTEIVIADGAHVVWDAQPLVLAAGCDLQRRTGFHLSGDAAVLASDTLVLGRHGEEPGRARTTLSAFRDGAELHVETLDSGDRTLLRSPVVAGDARILHQTALLGRRGDAPDALQLAGPGTLLPVLSPSLAEADRRIAPVRKRWRALLTPSAVDLAAAA